MATDGTTNERTRARSLAVVTGAFVASALLAAACTSESNTRATLGTAPRGSGTGSAATSGTLAPTPPAQPPPLLDQAMVDGALGQLDGLVVKTMADSGVPGMAVAVVYKDKVVFAKGFGVRDLRTPSEKVDTDTIFELASLSKPLASTVVSGAVGKKKLGWDDPVVKYDPAFALGDPYVTEHATFADLFSHRTGLPDHGGDLLEDLGYDRAEVLARLKQLPLEPFRDSYAYTNFGLTAAGQAAAMASGTTWEELSKQMLYTPLKMTRTSSSYADYAKDANKASNHIEVDGAWQAAKANRDADAQSPAGGASSSVNDMAQWLRLQLGNGTVDGAEIVSGDALDVTHLPQVVSNPPKAAAGRTGFYGLGFNVSYDDHGRLKLGHSGAFSTGAATAVTMLPSEQLGIIVLTNGAPIGAAETITETFMDTVQNGSPTVDWAPLMKRAVVASTTEGRSDTDYTKIPPGAKPAAANTAYEGTYGNSYYGPLRVVTENGSLVVKMGKDQAFSLPLAHYDGDVFSMDTVGENAVGLTGVTFVVGADGKASSVTIEHLDKEKLGTFTRS